MIGYNFYPEPTGIGKYSGEMMYWLAKYGYDCTVITSYPYYPFWKVQEPYAKSKFSYTSECQEFESGGRLITWRCPMYVPSQPSGLKRILLDSTFLFSAALKLLSLLPKKRFEFTIVVAPSFQLGLLGILYKALRKSKFVYHIQDMQIEAARDLQLIKSDTVISSLFRIEKSIFNASDVISTISAGMASKTSEKAGKQVVMFPNWSDLELFYPIEDRAALKESFGFAGADKIVLYSGAIGEKQGIETMLHAARAFAGVSQLKFVICGSGPYKQTLEELATAMALPNVVFFPIQPHEKFNQFLNCADVHLVIQKSTASDLVMPSKLTTILAVGGLALITAEKNSGLYNLIADNGIGIVVDADNQEAFNEGLRQAISADNRTLNVRARRYAEDHLSLRSIMHAFDETVLT